MPIKRNRGALAKALPKKKSSATRTSFFDQITTGLRWDDLFTPEIMARVPPVPCLEGQILKRLQAGGVLEMNAWHAGPERHCLLGWAIVLAGPAGTSLEAEIGSARAGALIYFESTGRVPPIFDSAKKALTELKKRQRLK